MLAQIEKPTNDFHALARYLVHGREQPPNPGRVAWVLARNLPTVDPMLAAHYMTATAELSRRCTHACLHTVIAWRDDERPSPEVMQEIAARTLELAGIGDHQALVMGHGDKHGPRRQGAPAPPHDDQSCPPCDRPRLVHFARLAPVRSHHAAIVGGLRLRLCPGPRLQS